MVCILLNASAMGRAIKSAIGVALLFAIPRCSCNQPSEPNCAIEKAPNASFYLTSGLCGGEYCAMQCNVGFEDCNGSSSDGCETSTDMSSLHEHVVGGYGSGGGCGGGGGEVVGTIGSCNIVCESGWIDCDGNKSNGCETQGYSCFKGPDGSPFKDAALDASPSGPIVLLKNDPLGLVVCNDAYWVLDGPEIRTIDAKTLVTQTVATSPSLPSGGLACDGSYLYWTVPANNDASLPTGMLFRMDLASYFMDVVTASIDPGVGIDVRGGAAYFIARSGVDEAGSTLAATSLDDGGVTAWMPAAETEAYKAFALSNDNDWSLANGVLYKRPSDAGASPWIEAGSASALLTNEAGAPFAILHLDEDAGSTDAQAHDYFASLVEDDAGVASLVAIDASVVQRIVATSSASRPIAASANAIYAVDLPNGGATLVTTTATPAAYVATDGSWVVWATRSNGTGPASVWRAPHP